MVFSCGAHFEYICETSASSKTVSCSDGEARRIRLAQRLLYHFLQ